MLRTMLVPQRLWLLIAVLVVALFPFGWLGELLPAVGAMLGNVFNSVLAHAVGHTLLFFVIGLTLLWFFPGLRERPFLFIALIVLLGITQEGFQLAYKQRPLAFDDFRDLVTDLCGALVAFGVGRVLQRDRVTKDDRRTSSHG